MRWIYTTCIPLVKFDPSVRRHWLENNIKSMYLLTARSQLRVASRIDCFVVLTTNSHFVYIMYKLTKSYLLVPFIQDVYHQHLSSNMETFSDINSIRSNAHIQGHHLISSYRSNVTKLFLHSIRISSEGFQNDVSFFSFNFAFCPSWNDFVFKMLH